MEHHERLTSMKLRLLNDRVSRRVAWDIARANGWESLRDAEYLAVANLQADALVTIDEHLAEAAAGLVPVVPLLELQRDPEVSARAGGRSGPTRPVITVSEARP